MGTASSWKWKTRSVFLVVVVLLAGVAGCALGGRTFLHFLTQSISLPLWCIVLLSLGPVALVAGGIALLWSVTKRPVEMERRPLVVQGVRWRWWTELSGSLRVVPYCAACDLQLRPRVNPAASGEIPAGFVLHCNNCGQETIQFKGSIDHAPQLILDYFMQNLRKEFEISHPS